MFYQPIPANDNEAPSWKKSLAPGDVVSFRFPLTEGERGAAGERPKARPCLVLEVGRVGDLRIATIAYGTSSKHKANRGRDLRVECHTEIEAAGLAEPTRFVGVRRVMVPLGHCAFNLAHRDTPVLGHLTGVAFEAMQVLRARFQAEHDMAAEFRAAKRLKEKPHLRYVNGRRHLMTPELLLGEDA